MASRHYAKEVVNVNGQAVEVFKIDNDVNGNPRYVIHYLSILEIDEDWKVGEGYAKAVEKIHSIGGRKYTAKWFGGGLVFSSYNLRDTLSAVIPECEVS